VSEGNKVSETIEIVCVKYGTKYGADYVNKLYWGVYKNVTVPYKFSCFTEDGEGLDPNIKVKPLKHQWQAWWSKVHIFDSEQYSAGKESLVFYIDLDMVVSGNMDSLCHLMSAPDFTFATLTTEEIFCETVADGYNSSIMLFRVKHVEHLYLTLKTYYDVLLRFLMRFDHYLEMLVWDSGLIQKLLPGQVLDYSTTFAKADIDVVVPADCRVIAFPRNPKPHEIKNNWVYELWTYQDKY
jgi:hypothetical protein